MFCQVSAQDLDNDLLNYLHGFGLGLCKSVLLEWYKVVLHNIATFMLSEIAPHSEIWMRGPLVDKSQSLNRTVQITQTNVRGRLVEFVHLEYSCCTCISDH